MDDLVDVGVFDKDGKIIYLQKHKVQSGKNVFQIIVDQMPDRAGVDPLNKLIDKNSNGHQVKAKKISSR